MIDTAVVTLVGIICSWKVEGGRVVGSRLSHGAVGSRETQMENSTRELWLSGTGDREAVALSYLQP